MEDEWAAMDAGENLAIANVPTREFSYTPGIEIGERSVPAGMHDSSDMGQEEPVAEPGPKKASRRRAPKGAPQRATKGAPKRTKNFSHVEDEVMCAAYLTVSKDPIVGVNQALQAYWDRMEAYICTALKIKRDEARSRSSYVLGPYGSIHMKVLIKAICSTPVCKYTQRCCYLLNGCETRKTGGVTLTLEETRPFRMEQSGDETFLKSPFADQVMGSS
ncbi:uncharacterized protein LOC120645514 [Panicum virgatum]|uniref:uncharacterized protein LOC120645514 n=1 Tax=Panicum virgatum TaxID=38727 RepID=UPI0019D697BA|nr:uncharacterized protein LOC120645514 [Panicum virgatum]